MTTTTENPASPLGGAALSHDGDVEKMTAVERINGTEGSPAYIPGVGVPHEPDVAKDRKKPKK